MLSYSPPHKLEKHDVKHTCISLTSLAPVARIPPGIRGQDVRWRFRPFGGDVV